MVIQNDLYRFLEIRLGENEIRHKSSTDMSCYLKCKSTSTDDEVCITSLNSHFRYLGPRHQMLRRKKTEPKTPHFRSLNQDIVVWSQEEKCELKYDILIFSRQLQRLVMLHCPQFPQAVRSLRQ